MTLPRHWALNEKCVTEYTVQVDGKGPPELVTGGGDGAVRVWDVRQPDAPVAAFPPTATEKVHICLASEFIFPSALLDCDLIACCNPVSILLQHK